MTPDEVRKIIREELHSLLKTDRYLFEKRMQIADGRNIQLGLTTGTKIGTATNQKLGFFNATPVTQRSLTVLSTSGSNVGDDTARIGVNSVIAAIQQLGLSS